MKILRNKNKEERGFTIIETVISIGIFVVIFVALIGLFHSVMNVIRNNKAMLAANNIIVEELEIVRGMDYDFVKTDHGFSPPGQLASEKSEVRSGTSFAIITDITFVDDPFDGVTPADTFNKDYKKVRITVKWKNPITNSEQISTASTNVVPEGREGLDAGFGGMFITVFDLKGDPVSNATINITSTEAGCDLVVHPDATCSPITALTDTNGNLWISNLIPADDYNVVVTKTGYSTDQTYPATALNPLPEKPDLLVIDQKVTEAGFAIDFTGSINMKTVYFLRPDNWYANVTLTSNQTDASAVLLSTATGTDPLMNDVLVAFSGTSEVASPYLYLQKMVYKPLTGNYSREWPSDKKSVNYLNSLSPQLVVSPKDGTIYLVWSDDHDENGIPEPGDVADSNIYIKQINPVDGSRIGPLFTVVSNDASQSQQVNPSVTVDNDGNLYITWEDNRNGNWDIYAQKVVTYPAMSFPWGSTDFKVNSDTDMSDQLSPQVVVDNDAPNNFYVVWKSNSSVNFDILLSKFQWDKTVVFTEKAINTGGGTAEQYDPDLVYDGSNNLYAVWADERNSQPDIYAQKISKDGVLEWGADILINDDTYAIAHRTGPVVAYQNDTGIYISWEDTRNGGITNIYSSKIDTDGVRQWTYDFMASNTMDSVQSDPSIFIDSIGKPFITWQDDREDLVNSTYDIDIWCARYTSDQGNIIQGGVPVTFTSTKKQGTTLDDPPVDIPKFVETFTTDLVTGEKDITGLEWGSYNFAIDPPWCLVSTNPPTPLMVNPGETSYVVIDTCHP